jgi:hypothetical protein
MKTALAVLALILIGLYPPLLIPLQLLADGITTTLTELPWWFLLLAAAAAWAHHKLTHTRPRIRVVRGTATRKA